MKITKLVILFNLRKILFGIITSIILLFASDYFENESLKIILTAFSFIIVLNILISILVAFILYDKSDLYKLKKLPKVVDIKSYNKGIFIHASFDPISKVIQNNYPNLDLTVCDIYENRHEHESVVTISKKVFPPNIDEIKIDPTNLPFDDNSQDVIFAITALHEILSHNKRVQFFKEAKRVLKNEGIIIVSEQIRNPINFLAFNIGAFHFLTKKMWKLAIKESELKIIETQKITPFAEMIIIK